MDYGFPVSRKLEARDERTDRQMDGGVEHLMRPGPEEGAHNNIEICTRYIIHPNNNPMISVISSAALKSPVFVFCSMFIVQIWHI